LIPLPHRNLPLNLDYPHDNGEEQIIIPECLTLRRWETIDVEQSDLVDIEDLCSVPIGPGSECAPSVVSHYSYVYE
jgi:hypothetical protein